ncbi:MAG: hypothetical protein K4445_01445 [Deltaproteobacteria bacterium]|nr:hypothetical protein [Syntrophaceae bacterium]
MKKLKRVTDISTKTAKTIKGGKTCNCSCSCSCAQSNTTSSTMSGEKSATTLNTFI